MTKSQKSKALAVVEETPTAITTKPTAAELFAQDAQDAPTFGIDERSMPWLRIAQDTTPQVKRGDPSHIPGLMSGDFYTVLTQRVWPANTGLLFVPAHYTRNYTHWKPISAGGGLVQNFGIDRAASRIDAASRDMTKNGHNKLMLGDVEVVDAMVYYGLIVDPTDGAFEEAVLSLASTQLTPARRWNTLMQTQRLNGSAVPLYGRAYQLTSTLKQREKQSWSIINVDPGPWIFDLPQWHVLYAQAKQLHTAFGLGVRKINIEGMEETTVSMEDVEVPVGPDSESLPYDVVQE